MNDKELAAIKERAFVVPLRDFTPLLPPRPVCHGGKQGCGARVGTAYAAPGITSWAMHEGVPVVLSWAPGVWLPRRRRPTCPKCGKPILVLADGDTEVPR